MNEIFKNRITQYVLAALFFIVLAEIRGFEQTVLFGIGVIAGEMSYKELNKEEE